MKTDAIPLHKFKGSRTAFVRNKACSCMSIWNEQYRIYPKQLDLTYMHLPWPPAFVVSEKPYQTSNGERQAPVQSRYDIYEPHQRSAVFKEYSTRAVG